MKDYIYLGLTPADEECPQLGDPGYFGKMEHASSQYIQLLKRKFGPPPEGAALRVLAQPHDFGVYHEVVVEFDAGDKEAERYALACDWMGPATWDDDEPYDWRQFRRNK